MSIPTPIDAEFSDSSGKESDYYSCEEYVETFLAETEARIIESAGSKRKAPDSESQVADKQIKKRLKDEQHHDPSSLDTQPNPNNRVPFNSTYKQQHNQTHLRQREPCPAFCHGRKCKSGARCVLVHDNGLREEFLRERRIRRASTKAIKRQQKAEEEKELKSRQETTDPEFAIFVSGYEESHSWKTMSRFRNFKPVTIRFSGQFSAQERETLRDQYSLPQTFFRMDFSNIEDQNKAISKVDGKRVGYKGPELRVQRYIAGNLEDSTTVPCGGTVNPLTTSRAKGFHTSIQGEEMEPNRSYRLENVPEDTNATASCMRVKIEAAEMKMDHIDTLRHAAETNMQRVKLEGTEVVFDSNYALEKTNAPEETNTTTSWMRVKAEDTGIEMDPRYTLGYVPEETSTTLATNAAASLVTEKGGNAENDEDTEIDLQWGGYYEKRQIKEEKENYIRQFAKIDDSGMAVYD